VEQIKYIYSQLTAIVTGLGVPEETAPMVPGFVLLLVLGIILKLLLPERKKPQASKVERKRTPFSVAAAPDPKLMSSSEGRVATRHFDRTDTKLKSQYCYRNNEDYKTCTITSLSLSGLAFLCDETLEKGERVRFIMPCLDKSQDRENFQVAGAIVREKKIKKKQLEYGVQFYHIFSKDQEMLKLLIEKYE